MKWWRRPSCWLAGSEADDRRYNSTGECNGMHVYWPLSFAAIGDTYLAILGGYERWFDCSRLIKVSWSYRVQFSLNQTGNWKLQGFSMAHVLRIVWHYALWYGMVAVAATFLGQTVCEVPSTLEICHTFMAGRDSECEHCVGTSQWLCLWLSIYTASTAITSTIITYTKSLSSSHKE